MKGIRIATYIIAICILSQISVAQTFKATCYTDGVSCPGDCDAHVVFSNFHNGTANAFDPMSSRTSPMKCKKGESCTICFSSDETSCITTTYRGSGPPANKFDFTPAFFDENCSEEDLPSQVVQECNRINNNKATLEERVNCIENPDDSICVTTISEAKREKEYDNIYFQECLSMGERAFNIKYQDRPELQRIWNCTYEKFGTGRNSRGVTWKKLLPAACKEGSFVGQFGTDCCTADISEAACDIIECRKYFPKK